jgi:hypothetical protein
MPTTARETQARKLNAKFNTLDAPVERVFVFETRDRAET